MANRLPPLDYLHECFVYYPRIGELRWKTRPIEHFTLEHIWRSWNAKYARQQAGCATPRGHYLVTIFGKSFKVHRIIWKLMTGREPPASIDHIDGNPANNRWKNLRKATHTEQKWNARMKTSNTSGFRGVSLNHGKWSAHIRFAGSRYHLGRFDTKEEASVAYEAAARELHGEFYRS